VGFSWSHFSLLQGCVLVFPLESFLLQGKITLHVEVPVMSYFAHGTLLVESYILIAFCRHSLCRNNTRHVWKNLTCTELGFQLVTLWIRIWCFSEATGSFLHCYLKHTETCGIWGFPDDYCSLRHLVSIETCWQIKLKNVKYLQRFKV